MPTPSLHEMFPNRQAELLAAPILADPREPQHPAQPPTDEQWDVLQAQELLRGLCERFTYARVNRWLLHLAALDGKEAL